MLDGKAPDVEQARREVNRLRVETDVLSQRRYESERALNDSLAQLQVLMGLEEPPTLVAAEAWLAGLEAELVTRLEKLREGTTELSAKITENLESP